MLSVLELGTWIIYKPPTIHTGPAQVPAPFINGKIIYGVKWDLNKSEQHNIAVLGDSFTQCVSVGQEDCYTTKLAEKLNNKEEPYYIYNFGIGGFNTVQELNLLKEEVLNYKPEIVILQYTDNDIESVRKKIGNTNLLVEPHYTYEYYQNEPTPLSFPLPENINRFFAKNSYFFRFASTKYHYIKKNLLLGEERDYFDKGVEESFNALKEMAQICEKNNIKFTVVSFPPAIASGCSHVKKIDTQLETYVKSFGVSFISLCTVFEWLKLEEDIRDKEEGLAHYNKKGQEIAAEVIYQMLVKEKFIKLE